MVPLWFPKDCNIENEIVARGCSPNEITASEFRKWKSYGFSDGHIADALSGFPATGLKEISASRNEQAVMSARHRQVVHPIFRMVDSCAAEFAAKTPYYYSTYEPHGDNRIDVLTQFGKSNQNEGKW